MTDDEYERMTDEQKRKVVDAAKDYADWLAGTAVIDVQQAVVDAFKPPSPLPSDRDLFEAAYPERGGRKQLGYSYQGLRNVFAYTMRLARCELLRRRALSDAAIERLPDAADTFGEWADEMDARNGVSK